MFKAQSFFFIKNQSTTSKSKYKKNYINTYIIKTFLSNELIFVYNKNVLASKAGKNKQNQTK